MNGLDIQNEVHNVMFAFKIDAQNVIDILAKSDYTNRGYVYCSDFFALAGYVVDETANDYVWMIEDLERASIWPGKNAKEWFVSFPPPKFIGNPNAHPITKEKMLNILEEENNMATTTANINMNCTFTPVNSYKAKDEETLAYEEAKRKIQEEADKKIQKIMDDTAKKLEALENERFWARKKKGESEQAKFWKTRYDALVEAGFTEEQAWQMCMESFKAD